MSASANRTTKRRKASPLRHRYNAGFVERLEERRLLAIDAQFNGGLLTVVGGKADDIVITSQDALVKINGENPTSGPLHVTSLKALSVRPGSNDVNVDLSAVHSNKFDDLGTIALASAPLSDAERIESFAKKHLGENWQAVVPLTMKNLETITANPAWDEFYSTHIADKRFDEIDLGGLEKSFNAILIDLEIPTIDADTAMAATELGPANLSPQGKSSLEGDGGSGGFALMSMGPDGGEGGYVTIQGLDATVDEENLDHSTTMTGYAKFRIQLEAEYCDPFTLDFDTEEVTATEYDNIPNSVTLHDYLGVHLDNALSWGDAAEGAYHDVWVHVNGDYWKEPTETFEARISDLITDPDGPEGNATITVDSAEGKILDGDAEITLHDAQVLEGTSEVAWTYMEFKVTLSNPVVYDIELSFLLWLDESTTASVYDFTWGGGLVYFAAGDVCETFVIPIYPDNVVEDDEWFCMIGFYDDITWDYAKDEAIGTIIDDDLYIYASVLDAEDVIERSSEPKAQSHFVVGLSSPASGPLTVYWVLEPGTAAQADYENPWVPPFAPPHGAVEFDTDDRFKDIYVNITPDLLPEDDEYYFVRIFLDELPESPYRIYDDRAKGVILDDDPDIVPDFLPLTCPPDESCGKGYVPSNVTGDVGVGKSIAGTQIAHTAGGDSNPIVSQTFELPTPPANYYLAEVSGQLKFGKLQTNGTFIGQSGQSSEVYTYAPGDFEGGDDILLSFQADTGSFEPGAYDWKMVVTFRYRDENDNEYIVTTRRDSSRVIANRHTLYNEYGGWAIAELDRLIIDPATGRVAWVIGYGYGAIFRPDGTGGYVSPDGYFEQLTTVTEGYKLADPYGNYAIFDEAGYLRKRVDRNANERVYEYTEADDGDEYLELESITDPFGLTTTFVYSDGVLAEILDHAERATEIDVVGGLLTAIRTRDPDGTEPGANLVPLETTFSYSGRLIDAMHLPDGVSTYFAYDFAGRISRITHEDATFIEIKSLVTRALPDRTLFGTPENPAELFGPEVAEASVTNELGKTSHYKFDRFAQLTEYTDELGHTTTYDRNTDGLLTRIATEDPAPGLERQPLEVLYSYDEAPAHRMNLEQVAVGGVVVAIVEYDDQFNLVKTFTDVNGLLTGFVRDSAGNILEMRHADGSLDPLDQPAVDDIVTSYTYTTSGAAGLLNTITDARGNITDIDYLSSTGLISAITYAAGSSVAGTEQFFYDSETLVMTHSLDELDRRTDYFYDELDRLIAVMEPDPDPTANGDDDRPVWLYNYCACGRITGMIDPEGTITAYQFDPQRGWLSEERLVAPSFEEQQVWEYDYDATGRVTSVTDSQDRQTNYEYDDAGRLIKLTLPDPDGEGGEARPDWEYTYDKVNLVTAVLDPLGNQTDYEYNGQFRVSKVKQPAPSEGQARPEWNYVYHGSGEVHEAIDPEGRTTTQSFDDYGRLVSVSLSTTDGAVTLAEYAYDDVGNLRFSTDEFDRETERVYDERNRLIELVEPDPDSPSSGLPRPVTSFTYDAVSNLKTLEDPAGNTTEWFYDGLDRPIEEENELADSRFYEYDRLGRVTKLTDRLGRVTEREYNYLSQPTLETWKTAAGATVRTIEHAYNGAGLLESVVDSEGSSYGFVYDGLDRLSYTSGLVDGLSPVGLFNTYDALGNRLTMDFWQSTTLDHTNAYEYDALSRLKRVEQTGTTVATKEVEFTYLKDGRFDTIERNGGSIATSDFTYNARGQLTSLVHDLAASGEPDISHVYGYQGFRVASYTNVEGQVSYTYDNLDQLKGANWPGSANDESYSFDEAGNRTVDGASSYTVGVNNRLVSDGTYTYQYDAEGNRTARFVDEDESETLNSGDSDVSLYSWDHRNRLTKVEHRALYQSANDQVVSYLYDAFDRKIGRDLDSDGNGTLDRRERYVYDGADVIADFVDPDGTGSAPMALAKRYLHGPAVDQILAQEDLSVSLSAANRVLWHLSDNQGTVRDLVDNTGDLVEHYRYDAFGQLIDGDPTLTRYLYTGREFDADTGLQYNRARWYDSAVGRWLSEDPIGFGGGDYNLGRYVGNSATNAIDPSGLAGFGPTFVDEEETIEIIRIGQNIPDNDKADLVRREVESKMREIVLKLAKEKKHAFEFGDGTFLMTDPGSEGHFHGTSGVAAWYFISSNVFGMDSKGNHKCDFKGTVVILVPYAAAFSDAGPYATLMLPGGIIADPPSSTLQHELWHTDGPPKWLEREARKDHNLVLKPAPGYRRGLIDIRVKILQDIYSQLAPGKFTPSSGKDVEALDMLTAIIEKHVNATTLQNALRCGAWHGIGGYEWRDYEPRK